MDPNAGNVSNFYFAGLGVQCDAVLGVFESTKLPSCAGRALKQSTPVVVKNPPLECADCPLSSKYAGSCGLVQRMECGGIIYGVLAISVPIRFIAGEEEMGLICELADSIALALDKAATKRKLELTESALENSSDTVFWITSEGQFIFVNRAACERLGYSKKELLSMSGPDIDPNFPSERWPQHWQQMKSQKSVRFESHHQTKEGHVFPVEIYGSFVEQDHQEYIFAFVHDIAERKASEARLKESEYRFKMLHNASFGGIAVHDKGLILDCNQGLSEISGYSQEELLGMDGLLLIAESSRPWVMEHILAGDEKPYEAVGVRKDGQEYPIRLEGRQIPYHEKQVRVVEFRDITQQKKNERHMQEQLDELTRWYEAMLGRERRMMELKQEVNEVLKKFGQPPRYSIPDEQCGTPL